MSMLSDIIFNLMNSMNLIKYTEESHRLIAMYKYIHILQWQHEMYNNQTIHMYNIYKQVCSIC